MCDAIHSIDVLKVCCGVWEKASRDKRELSACRELGYNVCVLSKGDSKDCGKKIQTEGFDNYVYSTQPLKHIKSSVINRGVALWMWARFVKKLNPAIVSGHDIAGVLVAILARWLGYRGKIIYDSHEFELGRFQRGIAMPSWMVKFIEQMAIKNSEFVIVVNESIKNELLKIYRLDTPIIVVRSTPENWDINGKICEQKRLELLSLFPEGNDIQYIFMFHGLLGRGNGIEHIIPIVSKIDKVGLVLMGNKPSDEFFEELMDLSNQYGISDRIRQIDAVPYEDIWKYVGAVDFEFMLVDAASKSYYYSLPNKLFESIQSLTPIVSSPLPEMRNIVEKYDIGLVCNSHEIDENVMKIQGVMPGTDGYGRMKSNLIKAKEDLCWENEKDILQTYYGNLNGKKYN